MPAIEAPSQPSDQEVWQLLELTERILMARSLDDLAERALPSIADVTQSDSVFIYIGDSRLPAPRFLQRGLQPETASAIEKLCAEVFEYVVRSYCKRRQGETSCKGCDRPLWSWTPRIMYQDSSGALWTSRMKRRKLKSPFANTGS